MVCDPFLERQPVKHFLFGNLMHPFDEYLTNLQAALKHRTELTRRYDCRPAHHNQREQPSGETKHTAASSRQLGTMSLQRTIL
jgi:hypothetical protein